MSTLLLENTQEEIIREYLHAFAVGDVNGMLRYIHPAIHYERYISGKIETADNGTERFRNFLEQSAVGMDAHSLQLLKLETDNDRVDVSFKIITSEPYHPTQQPMKGWAMFWFMDEMILQLIVKLDTDITG